MGHENGIKPLFYHIWACGSQVVLNVLSGVDGITKQYISNKFRNFDERAQLNLCSKLVYFVLLYLLYVLL